MFGIFFKTNWSADSSNNDYFSGFWSGFIIYNLFIYPISGSAVIYVENRNIIKKTSIDMYLFTVASILISILNLIIGLIILIIYNYLHNNILPSDDATILWIILSVVILSFGFSLIISSLSVYLKDLKHIVPFITNLILWFSPVFYKSENIPENWMNIIKINPLTFLIEGGRDILINNKEVNIIDIVNNISISFIVLIIAIILYLKIRKGFSDVI